MQGKTNYLLPSGAGDISDVIEMLSRSLSNDIIIQVPAPPIEGNIWEDSEGNWTYDEGKRVKTIPHSFAQQRYANNVEDFQFIYQRERKQQPDGDEPTFIEWLIRRLKKGIEEHLTLRKEDTQVLEYLSVSKQMIEWLEKRAANNTAPGASHDSKIQKKKGRYDLSDYDLHILKHYYLDKGKPGRALTTYNAVETLKGTSLTLSGLLPRIRNFQPSKFHQKKAQNRGDLKKYMETFEAVRKALDVKEKKAHAILSEDLRYFKRTNQDLLEDIK